MKELSVGDRVICIKPFESNDIVSKTGTVVIEGYSSIGVGFDTRIKGLHSLNNKVDDEHGWWFPYNKGHLVKIDK